MENLDIKNAYDYKKVNDFLYEYTDKLGVVFFVKIEKELGNKFSFIKTGYYLDNQECFEITKDFEIHNGKRANTIGSIFVNEILPLMKKRKLSLQIIALCKIRERFMSIFLTKLLTEKYKFRKDKNKFYIENKF